MMLMQRVGNRIVGTNSARKTVGGLRMSFCGVKYVSSLIRTQ